MIDHVFCRLKFRGKILLLAAAWMALALPAFCQQTASSPQNASPKPFAYDVVTVKPDNTSNGYWKNTADGFSMGGMPLMTVIRTAYGVLMDDQLEGLPGWANSEPLQIQGKMDADTVAALDKLPPKQQWEQRKLMLQSLLADRFALKVHHATKDLPIYELTVAKSGSRMKKSAIDSGGRAVYSSGKIEAKSISMENFAMNLTFTVGRIIVDKTGLAGNYDFTLEFAPEGADPSDPRPSIFTALEEQLGLKLVPAKGPVDTIVVDHIERPTEN